MYFFFIIIILFWTFEIWVNTVVLVVKEGIVADYVVFPCPLKEENHWRREVKAVDACETESLVNSLSHHTNQTCRPHGLSVSCLSLLGQSLESGQDQEGMKLSQHMCYVLSTVVI